ncbi:hypothetical protein [Cupriavidus sp. YAF13]|uniref:hypothetical protein n=1 Tax=Cupriavidus sp. YAF13 TaxID=3233075 RepID=UPI003F917BA5
MNEELKDKWFGESIKDRISKIHLELEDDAVGLWQIIPFGRQGYGLAGEDLVEYVRRSLLALFAHGAIPVQGAIDGIHYWEPVDRFGADPQLMVQGVIDEWLASSEDPDPGGLWFAMPSSCEILKADHPE